jgi:hypothetical protein
MLGTACQWHTRRLVEKVLNGERLRTTDDVQSTVTRLDLQLPGMLALDALAMAWCAEDAVMSKVYCTDYGGNLSNTFLPQREYLWPFRACTVKPAYSVYSGTTLIEIREVLIF